MSLAVRCTQLSTVGDRTSPVASARVWNSLQSHVITAESLSNFHSHLKSNLFSSLLSSLSLSLSLVPISDSFYVRFTYSVPAQWFVFFGHYIVVITFHYKLLPEMFVLSILLLLFLLLLLIFKVWLLVLHFFLFTLERWWLIQVLSVSAVSLWSSTTRCWIRRQTSYIGTSHCYHYYYYQYFDTVGRVFLTCKNRLPYNLYCVVIVGDVKHCTIQSSPIIIELLLLSVSILLGLLE